MDDNSKITLNQRAVTENFNFIQQLMGDGVEISAVVKANAYGHGIEHIVPLFEKAGVNHFSVFDFNEAIRVHQSVTGQPSIMIMGWISDANLLSAIDKGFEFFVFNINRLESALLYAKSIGKKAKVHLEAETGMNRSGLEYEELVRALDILEENPGDFEFKGFCTHLAGAESISNYKRIHDQVRKYHTLYAMLEDRGIIPEKRHMANSAASYVYKETRMDLVRIGIMMYGFWPTTETYMHFVQESGQRIDPLQRVLEWKSQVMAVKKVKEGEFIGYGTSYLAQNNVLTALVPVGYAMGYARSLSNSGRVIVNGVRCGVIGTVNMNMIIVDISNAQEAQVGDEVVLIGKQGELEIKVSSFSAISNVLNYEILAHLPESIEREIIN
jgi:alanine racemase